MSMHDSDDAQLGFDALLGAAEADNRRYRFEQQTGHLPVMIGVQERTKARSGSRL